MLKTVTFSTREIYYIIRTVLAKSCYGLVIVKLTPFTHKYVERQDHFNISSQYCTFRGRVFNDQSPQFINLCLMIWIQFSPVTPTLPLFYWRQIIKFVTLQFRTT